MIRDVTTSWATETEQKGLYIIRCTKPGWSDRLRVGGGGLNEGKEGLPGRLREHAKPFRNMPDSETDKLRPFEHVVRAWALDGWTGDETRTGEKCLWRAVAVRYPAHAGTEGDKSIFIVPPDADLSAVIADVEADLRALEIVHANRPAMVDVPHVVTSRKGTPRAPRKHVIKAEGGPGQRLEAIANSPAPGSVSI